jgi:carbamoyltransferase
MLLVVPVNEDKQESIPAVNHMGTARVQTVDPNSNPLYHRLISSFENASGVPIVLNTSFNLRGEPIVDTPLDALKTFASSGIDCLVMGNFFAEKPSP